MRNTLSLFALLAGVLCLPGLSAAQAADVADDAVFHVPDPSAGEKTQRGYELLLQGEADAANEIFKHQKKDPFALHALALQAVLENNSQQGLELLCQAATVGKNSPWAERYIEMAASLLYLSRDPQPFLKLVKLADDDKTRPLLRDLLRMQHGHWLMQRGLFSEAEQAFKPLDYITHWALIGPFDNRDGAGFQVASDVEKHCDLETPLPGRNREVHWTLPEFHPLDGRLDLNELFEPRTHVLAYAATYVHAQTSGWAVLRAGCGGALAVWVNGQPAGTVAEYNQFGRDKLCAPVYLHQGWNQILVKTAIIEDTDWSFNLRLTRPEGGAVPGLRHDCSAQAQKLYHAEKADRAPATPAPEHADLGLSRRLKKILQTQPENLFALALSGAGMHFSNAGNAEDNSAAKPLAKAVALAPRSIWLKLELALASTDGNEARQALSDAHKSQPRLAAPLGRLAGLAAQASRDIIAENHLREMQAAVGVENMELALLTWAGLLIDRDRDYKKAHRQENAWGLQAEISRLAQAFTKRHPYNARGWIIRVQHEESQTLRGEILLQALSFCGGNAHLSDMRVNDLLRQGREVEAAEFFLAGLPARPCSVWAAARAARLFRSAGMASKSVELLEAFRRSAPENPDLLIELGTLRHLAGDKTAAVALFKEALRLKPNSPQTKDYLARLDDGGRMDRQFFEPYEIALKDLSVPAPEAYPGDAVVNILNQEVVRVNTNGSSSRMFHVIGKVLRPAGAQELRQHQIYYDPERQVVDILKAAVITPDGRELSRAEVRDRSTSAMSGVSTLIYDQHHLKVVTFGSLEPGSIIDLQYTIRDTGDNIYGDYFSDTFHLGDDTPTIRSQYVLDRPKNLEMRTKTFNTDIVAVPLASKDPQREIIKWELGNTPGLVMERDMPPSVDKLAQLQVTTMKSWQEVGVWCHNLFKDQFVPNDDMRALVADLTKDCRTPTEKLRAIHDWAIRNIRYLGIEFGRNGYKPHKAGETFKALYGDCKDTATLLAALLPLAGIECRVVLIRTVTAGAVPPDSLPLPNIFNHCIAYVPDVEGKSYWIDGTTDFHRLGEVPYSDEGAQVLVVDEKGGGFVQIPRGSPASNLTEQVFTVDVRKDGSATILQRDAQHGQFAPWLRQRAETPGQYERDAQAYAARRFNGGKMLKTRFADARAQGPMWAETEYEAPALAEAGGERRALPGSLEPLSLAQRYAVEIQRVNDLENWFCWSRKTETTYKLDAALKTAALPEAAQLAEPFAKFSRKVRQDGNTIVINDEFELSQSRISAADYGKFKAFCHKVDALLDQKILLEGR
jgi:predicted Zn-dependent protease